jgi:hypothetical protein
MPAADRLGRKRLSLSAAAGTNHYSLITNKVPAGLGLCRTILPILKILIKSRFRQPPANIPDNHKNQINRPKITVQTIPPPANLKSNFF